VSNSERERDTAQDAAVSVASERDRLSLAERAFDAGDYAKARGLSQHLRGSADPAISAAARNLQSKMAIDTIHLGVLVICCVLFCAIAYVYLFNH
jgi:hypothetical protein